MSDDKKEYDKIEGGPDITPDMVNLVHQTLETQGLLYYSQGRVYVPTEGGWRLLSKVKPQKEEIITHGSEELTSSNDVCIGITKSDKVSDKKDKDCFIGVKADKACKDLRDGFKDSLKGGGKLLMTVEVGGITDTISAYGSPVLKISSQNDIVIRKDDFIDENTLAIMADKSASELKKELVEKLKTPEAKIKITLEIR